MPAGFVPDGPIGAQNIGWGVQPTLQQAPGSPHAPGGARPGGGRGRGRPGKDAALAAAGKPPVNKGGKGRNKVG